MKKSLLILILLFSVNCIAQFSKTHYIPPLSSSASSPPIDQYLYISTPSLTPVNFRIIQIGANDVTGTVSRDVPFEYFIGDGPNTQLNVRKAFVNTVRSDKGFIVEAEDLIYVSARVIAGDGNHAGVVVSKGLAALGTQFRIGAFINTMLSNYSDVHYTFVSVMATENNTTVQFSDIKPGVILINNAAAGFEPAPIVLNSGQSFVMAVEGPVDANRDALIGSLVTSDKPIAVNCGSFGGSNGELNNVDLGFDQLVSAERTGKDYIFIKSTGQTNVERILIVAHEDDTDIFLSSNTAPTFTIDAGEYVAMTGDYFTSNGNLYVRTSKNVFAFQSVGDATRGDQANQEMFFVPPLSCETPKVIDNIPSLNEVGFRVFSGRVTLVTEVGSDLNFVIDTVPYTLAGLPASTIVDGPQDVFGNPGFVTYVITGLSGNVSVSSTTQLYLASYGSDGAATFGGFYSGFTFKPEVSFDRVDTALENCIPNVVLSVSTVTAFDEFQWFFNDVAIPGATDRNYTPILPGYYHVSATITSCGTTLTSDKIPVSSCPDDMDNDMANDNLDVDNDNDGIENCTESFGDQTVSFTSGGSGTITANGYSNSFTTTFPAGTGTPPPVPFEANPDGSFVTSTTAGNGNSTIFNMSFAQPVSISMEYPLTAATENLITSGSGFIISVPVSKTITVLNPTNQLLIDTNYDGIYESGITEFSSFEIRFRLNSATALAAGTGTFEFRAHLANTFRFTHVNLDDAAGTTATFRIVATCIPTDYDGDLVPDQLDYDSDNDGIPDLNESQGMNFNPLANTDSNGDGLDDAFTSGITAADTDTDGVPDFHDLDSDNNGIYDFTESGSTAADANNNGIIDGTPTTFGSNGIANTIETSADSGTLNYNLADTDGDGINDYAESDNDNDVCDDVKEAGFPDTNNDGYLGNAAPVTVNAAGLVTGWTGYTAPNPLYNISTPILVTTQPQDLSTCEAQNAVFTIVTNPGVTYQWQISNDGTEFTNLSENAVYTGTTTASLTVNNVSPTMEDNMFRVVMNISGNVCALVSDPATLTISPLPTNIVRTLIQCDTGVAPDGITLFNLSEADDMFVGGNIALTIEYYETIAEAETGGGGLPAAYANASNPQQLVVRITNTDSGCFSFSTLNLSANLLASPVISLAEQCDSDANEDGFFVFDLTQANIPANAPQTVRYYENETDALLEQNEIADPQHYVNLVPYQLQTLVARVENSVTENCTRLYQINIKVNPLPDILTNEDLEPFVVCVNTPTFSAVLDPAFQDGSSPADYTYQWYYEGEVIQGATTSTLTVTNEGLYSVEVTDVNGCSKTRFIPVIASSQAIIEDIAVTDMSFFNTVIVTLAANSYGDYVYSIDHPNAFQPSNVFADVLPGNHIVYVKDLNGCPIASQLIYVMGIPPYFTPNADGFNDTWNLRGAGPANANSSIYIFDRYGKLLQQISPAGAGWDGTFNGHPLPSDDYWYVIMLTDGRTFKGHLTLKR
ncbi:MAG TPA: T9SS type B sorting domain-containing protein [Flavobacterium sp.]|jgi:gliding motility-associated-like protein